MINIQYYAIDIIFIYMYIKKKTFLTCRIEVCLARHCHADTRAKIVNLFSRHLMPANKEIRLNVELKNEI